MKAKKSACQLNGNNHQWRVADSWRRSSVRPPPAGLADIISALKYNTGLMTRIRRNMAFSIFLQPKTEAISASLSAGIILA
jgi:hypothetical protein